MNIEKLFGSKAKSDILKYLIFRRQGVSMRALEAELGRTFPAIKKQIDVLNDAGIIQVDKSDHSKRSIVLSPDIVVVIRQLFLFALKIDIHGLIESQVYGLQHVYFGKLFGYNIEVDLVVVYNYNDKESTDALKGLISDIFRKQGIETLCVTFLSVGDWQKRLQLADRFVLSVMRECV